MTEKKNTNKHEKEMIGIGFHQDDDGKFKRNASFSAKDMKPRNNLTYESFDTRRVTRDILASDTSASQLLSDYTSEDINTLLQEYKTLSSQHELIEISKLLYVVSPHYRRLIKHYSTMATYSYVVVPTVDVSEVDTETLRTEFYDIAHAMKNMTVQKTFTEILTTAFIEDVFYGYVYHDEDSFMIQKLDYNYCRITSITNGTYNFAVDMEYFSSNPELLGYMPEEIRSLYNTWVTESGGQESGGGSGRSRTRSTSNTTEEITDASEQTTFENWVEIPSENTICIKIEQQMYESVPSFAGSFTSIFDIQSYKNLKKANEELNSYNLLVQEIPVRTDSGVNNDFVVDADMAQYFHRALADAVPEGVGVATSPMDINTMKFDRSSEGSNQNVQDAEKEFWSSNGTSQTLFSSNNSTTEGIKMSVQSDANIVYAVLTQLQKWVNRYLVLNYNVQNYSVDMLDTTQFTKREDVKTYMELATYGFPSKQHIASIMGIEPVSLEGLAGLEKDVLNLDEAFTPLQSSHTTSNNGSGTESSTEPPAEPGRPSNEETGEPNAPSTDRNESVPEQ